MRLNDGPILTRRLDVDRIAALRAKAERGDGHEDALELHEATPNRWGGRRVIATIVKDGTETVVRRIGQAEARHRTPAAALAALGDEAEADWELSI